MIPSSSPIWISRWTQLDSTLATGTSSRGTGTRLISPAFSTSDVVPELHATAKKLYGTSPQSTKTGKYRSCDGKIFVKTKVSTVIITLGFSSDQNAPSDMFR